MQLVCFFTNTFKAVSILMAFVQYSCSSKWKLITACLPIRQALHKAVRGTSYKIIQSSEG